MPWAGSAQVGSLIFLGMCLGTVGPAATAEQPRESRPRQVYHFGPDAGQGAFDTRRFTLSPEAVFDAESGSIRLARSVLLADETGTTDFHQTENLGERTQVKKEFVLD